MTSFASAVMMAASAPAPWYSPVCRSSTAMPVRMPLPLPNAAAAATFPAGPVSGGVVGGRVVGEAVAGGPAGGRVVVDVEGLGVLFFVGGLAVGRGFGVP